MIGVLAVVVAAVVVLVAGGGTSSSSNAGASDGFPAGEVPEDAIAVTKGDVRDLEEAAEESGCVLRVNPNEGKDHIADPDHEFKFVANPPTSGDHFPQAAADGAYYTDPPPVEQLVHSLEHGRIVYQWRRDRVTNAQIGALKKLYDDDPYHLLLVENETNMPAAVAATAWDRSITCGRVNDETFKALRLFYLLRLDKGPERVP